MMNPAMDKLFFSCILLALLVYPGAAQEKPRKTAETPPPGAELYHRHCVTCHGVDLKGAGPFPAPYRTPPDLTTLTRRHAGKFPAAYVSRVLENGVTLPAHGPAEMPVWGTDFAVKEPLNKAQVAARVRNLANYIKSMQRP